MSEIVPGLYLGDYFDASSPRRLAELKIEFVSTVADIDFVAPLAWLRRPESGGLPNAEANHKRISLRDDHIEDIQSHFGFCCEWIDSRIGKGNILVHCAAGISRSATIVIAYLLFKAKGQLTFDEVFGFVRQHRTCITPNPNFRRQLVEWEHFVRQAVQSTRPFAPERKCSAVLNS